MAKVKQEVIEKAQRSIKDHMTSPVFPSGDDLLKSNRKLYHTVRNIKALNQEIPEKTLCGLLVDALEINESITGEALWKRYQRLSNRDGSVKNRDASSNLSNAQEHTGYSDHDINRDGLTKNKDADSLFIPAEISQSELAAGLGEFFESKGYPPTFLLKTCINAIQEMSYEIDAEILKQSIDLLLTQPETASNSSHP